MRISILGVHVNSTSYVAAANQVVNWAKTAKSCYVCIANVHMLMEAHDSSDYKDIVNSADYVTPDGMPLVWMMRLKKQHQQKQVRGLVLMLRILEYAALENIPVGFYGSKSEVLNILVNRLKKEYYNLKIVYIYSPPYRDLNSEEKTSVIKNINNSKARIMFVGLGCPKQEKWMAAHRGKINAVMIGVGAAFDFHAGVKPQAPLWMQKIGLEWLYRLIIEPRRLWWRYFYHNPRFIFFAILDLLNINSG
jgi:N-acetylglucosaminyldiphosphoundecaprenol N-acetyl-beta-D-mannosaminyltransferase